MDEIVAGTLVLSLSFYLKYNARKEEKERHTGYPDLRPYPNGRIITVEERELINKRMLFARCVYGMYYRFRKNSEYKSWWEAWNYDLVENKVVLKDDCKDYDRELRKESKDLYFGVLRRRANYPRGFIDHGGPKWIVAVRGTEITSIPDLKKDVKILFDILPEEEFNLLYAVVKRLIGDYGCENVALTGHSLGAAAGMLVGRRLAEEGIIVEGHFFNPPFATLKEMLRIAARFLSKPLKSHIEDMIQKILMNTADFVTLGLKVFVHGPDGLGEQSDACKIRFRNLSRWSPHIYVNRKDLISKQFIEYFEEYRERASEYAEGNNLLQKDAFHALPRAVLHVSDNLRKIRFISSHMLWNWTRPDLPYVKTMVNLVENK